ncbi:DUF2637 domain-containing protein [Actinomadura atramentaria]|uniref:DUF2637 domain-containing protein n=1 Tax=Actinomadura atramentaria TaxID=1990 RepID=UPI0003605182|nr:DUF2637 domain-containing protein [Actinomadura atramentaria]
MTAQPDTTAFPFLGAQATNPHAAETPDPTRPITRLNDTPPPSFGTSGEGTTPAVRRLTGNEFTAVVTVAALVGVLGVLGFVNSFAAVAKAAEPSFGPLAWTVPLGIDLGIGIFAALDIVLARLDMRVRWLRFIPWSLTAATVWLNVNAEHTAFGMVAHAILPGLWVIAVEVAAHVIRVRAGIESGTRMDGIRASRWVLAPWPTLKLWRRMVLWETRSYPDALNRERSRLLVRTDLQDTYGALAWRWKAPRRVRALYRLGELAAVAAERETVMAAPADAPLALTASTGGQGSGTGSDKSVSAMADTERPAKSDNRPGTVTVTRTSAKSARKRATKPDRLTAKARALLADDPTMTGAELGRRLKVSERTGSRLRNRITTETANATTTQEGTE